MNLQLANEEIPLVPKYRDLLLAAIDHGKLDIAERLVRIGVNCKRKEKVGNYYLIAVFIMKRDYINRLHYVMPFIFHSTTMKTMKKYTWMHLIDVKRKSTMNY